jgi:hypothetical protein
MDKFYYLAVLAGDVGNTAKQATLNESVPELWTSQSSHEQQRPK